MKDAFPFSCFVSSTVSMPWASSRSATTTSAPSRAASRQVARPMPDPPPVINATLSFRFMFASTALTSTYVVDLPKMKLFLLWGNFFVVQGDVDSFFPIVICACNKVQQATSHEDYAGSSYCRRCGRSTNKWIESSCDGDY